LKTKKNASVVKEGDVHLDDSGNPIFYGDIDKELGNEHNIYDKMFQMLPNPAFYRCSQPPAIQHLQSLSDFCKEQGIALTKAHT
jgi:hypothetical protein